MSAYYEFMAFQSQFVKISKMHVGAANWLEKGQHCQGSHLLINLFGFLGLNKASDLMDFQDCL